MNINWTYSPNSLQTVRTFVETRDYRAIVPPGHGGRGVPLTYRALAPGGAGFCYRICTGTSESRLTAHYSLLTANSSYTFSAKEKDVETGLSYFGARYYSSDLSVWLSVDPMSDKYPYQSGYVYCGNNPIKVIDPNGEDEWEIDKQGNVNWVRQSETHRLYALDKNRKRTGDYITVKDKSSLEQLRQSREDYNGHYSVCNKEDAFKIFKFGADHCDVEWAVAGYNTKGGGREYVVGTSNEIPENGYSGTVYDFHSSTKFDKFDLSFYIHSHQGANATQGASKDLDGSDMGNIIRLYYAYLNSGRSTTPGKGFPRHYVYTPNTKTLYGYTAFKSSIYIRGKIRSANDLYRNLSF